MSDSSKSINPFDLVLERIIDVPVETVWRAWTEPERLKQWFTPRPWTTVDARIDLRPGGMFRTVMQGPDGETIDNAGCILEVVEGTRLVWTGALRPGFRPVHLDPAVPVFTACIQMLPEGNGTRYIATAMHADQDGRDKHDAMGFHHGWEAALDQLVEVFARADE
jgi:uncharacterized protein YndB with AHSA1/START domain